MRYPAFRKSSFLHFRRRLSTATLLLSLIHLLFGMPTEAQTFVNIRTNADGVWASGRNRPELGNSLTDGNFPLLSLRNGTGNLYAVTAVVIQLSDETTITHLGAVVGHVFDDFVYSDNITVQVWSELSAFAANPLLGNVWSSEAVSWEQNNAPYFGGVSQYGYKLHYGTFQLNDFTLPPGDYLISLIDDNGGSFVLGQSTVEQTVGITGLDYHVSESAPVRELGYYGIDGTLALDIFALDEQIPGDYDSDDDVDGADYLNWQREFGSAVDPAGSGADGNGDGVVDAADYAVWRDNYGAGVNEAASSINVPEPSALMTLALATAVLALRRRRLF